MIKKIDHIGIVTDNYREIIVFFEGLGLKPKEVETQNRRFALIPVGDGEIEIIEGDRERYHIALQVDEIESAIEKLKENGIKMRDEKPRVSGAHGYKIAFLNPESTKGILIELCERS